jgi:malonyl-ACP O-methyltransferase BioC
MDRAGSPGLLYDAHADAQGRAARDLMAITSSCRPLRIFEPGCGTGLYTALLAEAFPDAVIDAVDKRADMAVCARAKGMPARVSFRVGDAEEISCGRYDLITSNAAFQWFRRLEDTLARYMSMVSDGGALTFSFFGPGTYRELATALGDVFGQGCRIAAAGFRDKSDIETTLAPLCRRLRIEERVYQQRFACVVDVLRGIKHTGARGAPSGMPRIWTPATLARLERAYMRRNDAVVASFEVLLVRAEP